MNPFASDKKKEYELVLMVKSSQPESVLDRILQLRSVGDYRLRPSKTKKMHDVYFDTRDGALGRHRLNLRLRGEENNSWRVTLKKSPGLFTRNRNEREETELDFSLANWDRIRDEIRREGVKLQADQTSEAKERAPLDIVKSWGLKVIQDRETLRRPLEILSGGGELVAELAVDSVTYHFDSCDVSLDEMEVEAKSENFHGAVGEVVNGLVQMFGSELGRWRSGKLSTGMKIEKLLNNGRLTGMVSSDDGRVKLEAYELIASA